MNKRSISIALILLVVPHVQVAMSQVVNPATPCMADSDCVPATNLCGPVEGVHRKDLAQYEAWWKEHGPFVSCPHGDPNRFKSEAEKNSFLGGFIAKCNHGLCYVERWNNNRRPQDSAPAKRSANLK
jgi:hypothetical protein